MTYRLSTPNQLCFVPVGIEHTPYIVKWRNTDLARASFFDQRTVTPGRHAKFLESRHPDDLVWMVYSAISADVPLGMTSLTVNVNDCSAEYGRLYIDEAAQGQGVARRIEWATLWAGFEWMRLDRLWLEAYTTNKSVIGLHERMGWVRARTASHPDSEGRFFETLIMEYTAEIWQLMKDRVKA